MSTKKVNAPRRLERYRAKVKGPKVVETPGRGHKAASEGKAIILKAALALKKQSNKHMRELESLDVAALQDKLIETRKELFDLRMQHATGQVENVSKIPAAKRQIARILTLIKQKEVGA